MAFNLVSYMPVVLWRVVFTQEIDEAMKNKIKWMLTKYEAWCIFIWPLLETWGSVSRHLHISLPKNLSTLHVTTILSVILNKKR